MAHSAQAKKRIRQNEKHRLMNKGHKSEIKTLTKSLIEFVRTGDADGAREVFPRLVSRLDKAVKSNLYHENNVARKKSRMAALLDSLKS